MRKLTISSIGLGLHCAYSFRPDVDTPRFGGNKYTEIGNEFHDAVIKHGTGQDVPPMSEETQSFFDTWSVYDFGDLSTSLYEIAIAFHPVTGSVRILGYDIHREYAAHGALPEEFCGSVDLASIQNGVLVVRDWKTGLQYHLDRYDNNQNKVYTAALMRYLGLTIAISEVVVINSQGVYCYPQTLDKAQADAILAEAAELCDTVDLDEPPAVPGTHCATKYCQLAATCPALAAHTTALQKTVPLRLSTRQEIGQTVAKLVALETQAKAIWQAIDVKMTEIGGDVELPDGSLYGPKETTRESIQLNSDAMEYLEHNGFTDAIETKITKAAIERIVKAKAPKGKAASHVKQVIRELRELDVISTKTTINLGIKTR